MLHTGNDTDGNQVVIFSSIALYYADTYIVYYQTVVSLNCSLISAAVMVTDQKLFSTIHTCSLFPKPFLPPSLLPHGRLNHGQETISPPPSCVRFCKNWRQERFGNEATANLPSSGNGTCWNVLHMQQCSVDCAAWHVTHEKLDGSQGTRLIFTLKSGSFKGTLTVDQPLKPHFDH